jgi:ABC-2 type transport system permease protein
VSAIRVYPTLLRAFWAKALQERVNILIWILTGAYPLVMMAVWVALAQRNGGQIGGYSDQDFIGYFLAVSWLRRITYVWVLSDYEQPIRSGELSPLLLRPLHYMHQVFAEIIAVRFLNLLVAGAIVFTVAWFAPGQQFDLSPGNLLVFALVTALGFVFEFVVQSLFGCFAFWTTQVYRLFDTVWFFKSFMGGFAVPMTLLPESVQAIARWLPFRISMALPAEILTGRATTASIVEGVLVGAVWTLLLLVATAALWRRGVRAYSAVGA